MICVKKINEIEHFKKIRNTIQFLTFISNKHPLYNYITHLMKYILDKHRKYNIIAKMYDPSNNLVNKFNIYSFPSSLILKNDQYIIYNGTDINHIEKCLNEFIN